MKRISAEEKMIAVKRRLERGESLRGIGRSMGLHPQIIRDWCRRYQSLGPEAFIRREKNNKYTLEFKTKAVEHYLQGKGSMFNTCMEFKIPSPEQLRRWIKMYNGHKIKTSPGGKVIMTKGRKTTLQERIDIVTDHLESGMSYAETANKYDVSYQQVYQWIQKYKENGIDGLVDRRGRTKPLEEMTEIEKLQAENRILKAKLERKELENLFLKKVEEIERRRS